MKECVNANSGQGQTILYWKSSDNKPLYQISCQCVAKIWKRLSKCSYHTNWIIPVILTRVWIKCYNELWILFVPPCNVTAQTRLRPPRFGVHRSHKIRQTHTHTHLAELFDQTISSLQKPCTHITHNKHKRQTSMTSVGLKPANPAIKQTQTYALEHAVWVLLLSENKMFIQVMWILLLGKNKSSSRSKFTIHSQQHSS